MQILITGGAGFIGSNFVHYILRKYKNHKIIVLDKLTYCGRKENLENVIDKIKFVKGDICDKELVESIVKECDCIINFAAETHVDRSIIDSGSFIRTDVFGVYNLLEAARKFNTKKFIHISTDEVYGPIERNSFKESDRLNPRNPYAASKAAGDMLVMSYQKTYNIPAIITRSSNNYGFYHHPEKFIPKAIIYAMLNRKIPLYGSGRNVRDWLFVEDNCEAVDLILRKGKIGEIYNIGGKQEFHNIDVVNFILEILGKGSNLIEFVKDRPGHDFRYSLDINKIKKLGWKPRTKFKEGLRKTIEWYEYNTKWWKPILENQQIDFHKFF